MNKSNMSYDQLSRGIYRLIYSDSLAARNMARTRTSSLETGMSRVIKCQIEASEIHTHIISQPTKR
jgi:hypothetical protein